MRKTWGIILMISGVIILMGLGIFYWKNLRGIGPVIESPPEDITKIINTTGMPLKIPPGFAIEIFAKNLPGARVMKFVPYGGMTVSQPSEGTVSYLELGENGNVTRQSVLLENLRKPHGLAIGSITNGETSEIYLYIAAEDGIYRRPRGGFDVPPLEKIADLPFGDGHFTRTIEFGPDERLYVSIGSSCNVCDEKDGRRAKIFSMNPDGSDFKEYARGLRNTVFFTWSYVDGRMWGTDMGRDYLGDELPPDEINIIEEGKDYGWPVCYGKNVHDREFDKDSYYFISPCTYDVPSFINIPAHSAPLGLAFVPEEGWPEEYWYDLLVAYHGSWNRSQPTGYKIVRIKLDDKGNYEGTEDFITGWLTDKGALGRPVDILVQPGGTMFISDDKAGVIYRLGRISEENPSEKTEAPKKVFITEKGDDNIMFVDTPDFDAVVKNPLFIKGKARGNWYFEASFPVTLFDAEGNILAQGHAEAQGNWMTSDFVPFEAKLEFTPPASPFGTLVLEKDNPSGLPEHADKLTIPIQF